MIDQGHPWTRKMIISDIKQWSCAVPALARFFLITADVSGYKRSLTSRGAARISVRVGKTLGARLRRGVWGDGVERPDAGELLKNKA